MGHDAIAILDGGLPAWVDAGLATEKGTETSYDQGDFKAKLRAKFFCDSDTVLSALQNKEITVSDARSEGRFLGIEPEPRQGLRSGHMPGSINLPYSMLLRNRHLLSDTELAELMKDRLNKEKPTIFSCGSGVTACICALGAEIAGYKEISVYDGSWSEWGLGSGFPVTAD